MNYLSNWIERCCIHETFCPAGWPAQENSPMNEMNCCSRGGFDGWVGVGWLSNGWVMGCSAANGSAQRSEHQQTTPTNSIKQNKGKRVEWPGQLERVEWWIYESINLADWLGNGTAPKGKSMKLIWAAECLWRKANKWRIEFIWLELVMGAAAPRQTNQTLPFLHSAKQNNQKVGWLRLNWKKSEDCLIEEID